MSKNPWDEKSLVGRLIKQIREEDKLYKKVEKLLSDHTCHCEDCKSSRGLIDSITRARLKRVNDIGY